MKIMENPTSGLHDKLGSLSKSDLLVTKKDEPNGKTMEPVEATGDLVQRCVIIQRDEKGYGLTVSGDNPVFVQVVKEDGAAARAGVLQGDRIIKVNGTLVTQSNHQEVVKLIKSGSYVALTLLGKPPGQGGVGGIRGNPVLPIAIPSHPVGGQNQTNRLSSSSERITGPQPVDPEKQQEVNNNRIQTIKKMYDKEVVFLETLQAEYSKNPTELVCQQIQSANKRIKTLEEQLISLTGCHPEYAAPRSPRSPPTLRQCHSESSRSTHSPAHGHGKHLTHQTSAPMLQKPDRSPVPMDETAFKPPSSPPVPSSHPPPAHHNRQNSRNIPPNNENWTGFPGARPITVSTSLENLSKNNSNSAKTWPHVGPTHSRQSSSPESLLHNINLQQILQEKKKIKSTEWLLTRSHSELGQQCYPRKMSATDALQNDCDAPNNKSWRPTNLPYRGTSYHHFDFPGESPHNSPPGTPPPTSVGHGHDGYEVKGIDVDEYYGAEEAACTPPTECLHANFSHGSLSLGNLAESENEILETISPLSPQSYQDDLSIFSASTPDSNSSFIVSPTTGALKYGTPPEEQSSPTSSIMTHGGSKIGSPPYIVCMEEEEMSSDSEGHRDDHGPFNSLWKLLKNQAHLAVFIQYLILNRSPASMFFYILSNIYEAGTGKEMKKWAYEIHSTFLVPGAPLRVKDIEETILHEIDDGLQHHLEKEDTLRPIFRRARKKARENLNSVLAEFRNKRAIGLGNIYGPKDYQLDEAIHDKNKELKIIEQVLVPTLEKISEDPDNVSDEDSALASSLATILKQFGVKGPQALTLVDKWPTFVAKEKSRLKFLQRNKKSICVQNHQFVPQHYCSVTYCNHCQNIIWGVGNQGYQCQHCEMNIHKSCVKVVEESCIGAFKSKKDKRRERYSGLMENIIGKSRKPSHPNIGAIERAKRLNEEAHMDNNAGHDYSHIIDPVERSNSGVLRVDKLRERFEAGFDDTIPLGIPPGVADNIDKIHNAKKGTSIGRSESFRQRRDSKPSFRKRSDPNIPRSKSDVEVESNLNNSGSSSNSSLSASLDSPSNSQEMVHRTNSSATTTDSVNSNATTLTLGPSSNTSSLNHPYDDSDMEAEADPPNWQESVDWDFLKMMKPKEKKRQDVINELFHTERTHVRNLKVLDRVFFRPMLHEQLLPADQLQLLFPNVEEMLEIHDGFHQKMKCLRKEDTIIGNIGEVMLQMLDGHSGEMLKKAAATFCRNQSMALENLKNRQRKDQKLAVFLSEAEANNVCRRLQLKDIIVTGFQRLTKYPLLLENVAKYTTPNSDEHTNLLKAVECSRQILAHVNQAVKEAENIHRLSELQKNLDKSSFVKIDSPISHAFRHLDFNNHKLVYEGPLTWKLNKQKSIDVHVVLLEDILVLLLKQDEKYVLKFQNINITTSKEEGKMLTSPILRVRNLFTRNVATDKKGFFLLTTSDQHAMYEFAAASMSERKTWLRHITEAIELYKTKPRTQEPLVVPDRIESTEENNEEAESQNDVAPVEPHLEPNDQMENQEAGPNFDISPQDGNPESTSDESASSQPSQMDAALSPPTQPDNVVASSPGSKLDENDDGQQRMVQRVEILKIADGPHLIEPYEVVVRPSAILQTAEPVLTPVEQLKRKDMQIRAALAEKEELVAKILQVPKEEFGHILEMAEEGDGEKDVQELLLSAINQANRLTKLLNESLRVTEEDAISATSLDDVRNSPSPKIGRKYGRLVGSTTTSLRSISASLNKYLTQLLVIVSSREEERKQLRKELYNSREQIHLMHEAHRHCSVRSRSPSSSGNHSASQQSRPNSFVSVASSTSEGVCDLHHASADDIALLTNPLVSTDNSDNDTLIENESSTELNRRLCGDVSTTNYVSDCANVLKDNDSSVTLTTSVTSEEGGGEMFVDAPTSFPHQQNTSSSTTNKVIEDDCSNLPVTDLDSTNQSPLSPDGENELENIEDSLKNIENEKTIQELEKQSVGAKETVTTVEATTCNDEKQRQKGNELVDPIYF